LLVINNEYGDVWAGKCYDRVQDEFPNISRCKDEHNSITTAGEPESIVSS